MNFHFEHIEFAWLFALVLPAAGIWFWWENKKRGIIKGMATSPVLLKTLLTRYHPGESKHRLMRIVIAMSGIIIALMNPVIVDEKASVSMEGVQLMLAMDVSKSMLASDVAPTRLEKARTFAVKLSEALGGNKIGLLGFAGEARLLMPPTSDLSAVLQGIRTLNIESVPLQGTNIEAALIEAERSLSGNRNEYKAVVLITDGEELEGKSLSVVKTLRKKGMVVQVVGVGTVAGILLADPFTRQPILNEKDEQVVTRLNEKLLSQLASAAGGGYFPLADTRETIFKVKAALNKMDKIAQPNEDLINYKSLATPLLFLSIFLLCWEVFATLFRPKFSLAKKPLAYMVVFSMLSISVIAQKGSNVLTDAGEAYQSGEYVLALEKYKQVLQKDPQNTEAKFYAGLTKFKQKLFGEALADFTEIASTSAEEGLRMAAYNNIGLCHANENRFAEAIEMFKQAIKMNPGDRELVGNLQKAILDYKKSQPQKKQQKKQQQSPLDQEEADRRLQSVMEEERKTREKLKPRPLPESGARNW